MEVYIFKNEARALYLTESLQRGIALLRRYHMTTQRWQGAKQSEKRSPLPSLGKHETTAGTSVWRGRDEMVCGKEQLGWSEIFAESSLSEKWTETGRGGTRKDWQNPAGGGKVSQELKGDTDYPGHGAANFSKPALSSSRHFSLLFGGI